MPLALTLKSVSGSRAAQSWDGWAAVWTTSSIRDECRAKRRLSPSASRMSRFSALNWGWVSIRRRVVGSVEASAPKNAPRISLSTPTTSQPSPIRSSTRADPTSPPDPVMIATATDHAARMFAASAVFKEGAVTI